MKTIATFAALSLVLLGGTSPGRTPGSPSVSTSPGPTGTTASERATPIPATTQATIQARGRARATATATSPAGRWSPPVEPFAVLRDLELGPYPWSPGHRGVDLAAEPGKPLVAPAPGVVVFAGTVAGTDVVVVAHAAGLRSTFQPARAVVPVGAVVAAGAPVAVAGQGSHCGGAGCVHWGVLRGGTYLDPLAFLGRRGPVVLLPVRAPLRPAKAPRPPGTG